VLTGLFDVFAEYSPELGSGMDRVKEIFSRDLNGIQGHFFSPPS
jgi:hypothetical protein